MPSEGSRCQSEMLDLSSICMPLSSCPCSFTPSRQQQAVYLLAVGVCRQAIDATVQALNLIRYYVVEWIHLMHGKSAIWQQYIMLLCPAMDQDRHTALQTSTETAAP
jgi:hypothetical protein